MTEQISNVITKDTVLSPLYSNYADSEGKTAYCCPFEVEGTIDMGMDSAEEALEEANDLINQRLAGVKRELSIAEEYTDESGYPPLFSARESAWKY